MSDTFDRRVVPEALLEVTRAVQRRSSAHLGGGAALSGAHLRHRFTRDLDLFVHDAEEHRRVVAELASVAREAGVGAALVRDGGAFVRARLEVPGEGVFELDLIHETIADLEPPPAPIEGIVVESLADLRAAKITCLLSRSEPRDLVDVLFLERAGWPLEPDLPLALQKDAGIDPATLAWVLQEFPVRPLPRMLLPLTEAELRAFRDDLVQRLRRLAVP